MNLKKWKKIIIPLVVVKAAIFGFFIFGGGELVSISRDVNYSTNYQESFDSDSIIQKKQKLIRIVRNDDEKGISIKLRARKNARHLRDKEGEIAVPLVD